MGSDSSPPAPSLSSSTVKSLVAGGIAGAFAKSCVSPIERVKILFQVSELAPSCHQEISFHSNPSLKDLTPALSQSFLAHPIVSPRPTQPNRQVSTAAHRDIGIWASLVKIGRTEGVLGYWKGNGANCARVIPYAAVQVPPPPSPP
jgi:hypothetical protein